MATSSIFESFNIRDKKSAELFVNALKSSENLQDVPKKVVSDCKTVKNSNEIKMFFKKMG